ncbi:MAG: substrate-binding periplasmic protein [Marinobacter sp.]
MRHCIMALMLLVGTQTSTAEDLPLPEKPATLAFNVSVGGHPPFTIVHDDGRVSGIFWDVLNTIARRHEFAIRPVQVPPKRTDSLLRQGHVDITMRAIEWTDEPGAFVFSRPVMNTRDAIFVHRDREGEIRHVQDLKGPLLSRLGFHYPWLERKIRSGEVTLIPVQEQKPMFRRLLHGGDRFAGAISNLHVGRWTLRKSGWDDQIRQAPLRLDEVGYRLMFPHRHKDLVPLVNRELERMKASGELDRIIRAYQ